MTKKTLIIIAAVVALALAAGVGAWMLVARGPEHHGAPFDPAVREASIADLVAKPEEALTADLRQEMNLEGEQEGVVVTDVEFGSEAAARGIQPGMLVIAVNDRPVGSVADWRKALDRLEPGSTAKVDVLANQQTTFYFLRIPRN